MLKVIGVETALRMYGVVLDSILEVMRSEFDAEQWREIQRLAGISQNSNFSEFNSYSENVIPRLTSAAHLVTGVPPDEVRH